MASALSITIPGRLTGVRVVGPDGNPVGPGPADPDNHPAIQEMKKTLAARESQLAQAARAVAEAHRRIDEARRTIVREAEEGLVDLAVEVARRIVRQAVEAGDYRIDKIVHEALAAAPARTDVVVHLNPADLDTLRSLEADGEVACAALQYQADPDVGRAECVVETVEGSVETRIEDQLDQVHAALNQSE